MSNVPEVPKAPPVVTTPQTDAQILELLEKVSKLESKVDSKLGTTASQKPLTADDIDWTKVTEAQVFDLSFPIPVIEHELPDYMNIHLRDQNNIARWVHHMPRHLGSQLASGYSYITKEDWDENFPLVLQFNTEGHLIYDDVVALKIDKRRYFSALRRTHVKSTQIGNIAGMHKVKGAMNQAIQNNPRMEAAIGRGAMAFYGEEATSGIEQFTI